MKLIYDPKDKTIYYETNSSEKKILDRKSPSKPLISPNKNLAAYIAPTEWEEKGIVHLVDLKNMQKKELYQSKNDDLVPKNIAWIDNETIGLVLGYRYGTVAVGGNVFIINIMTKELTQLTHFSNDIQITDVTAKDKTLNISGIKYKDNRFVDTEDYKSKISLIL